MSNVVVSPNIGYRTRAFNTAFTLKRVSLKMKLITYNFLTSSAIKGVKIGYPLKLHVSITFGIRIDKI